MCIRDRFCKHNPDLVYLWPPQFLSYSGQWSTFAMFSPLQSKLLIINTWNNFFWPFKLETSQFKQQRLTGSNQIIFCWHFNRLWCLWANKSKHNFYVLNVHFCVKTRQNGEKKIDKISSGLVKMCFQWFLKLHFFPNFQGKHTSKLH